MLKQKHISERFNFEERRSSKRGLKVRKGGATQEGRYLLFRIKPTHADAGAPLGLVLPHFSAIQYGGPERE